MPALRLDGGELLTETAALLQYVADLAPAARLSPPPGTFGQTPLSERAPRAYRPLPASSPPPPTPWQMDTSAGTRAPPLGSPARRGRAPRAWGLCVKAAGEGEACQGDASCAEPLRCVLGACSAAALSGQGGPCLSDDDCQPGLACAGADGVDPKACAPKRAAGEACTGAAFVSECAGRCDAPLGQPSTCASFCGSR